MMIAALCAAAAVFTGCASSGPELSGELAELPVEGAPATDQDASSGTYRTLTDGAVAFTWTDGPVWARWRSDDCTEVRVDTDAGSRDVAVSEEFATVELSQAPSKVTITASGCTLAVDHLTARPRPASGSVLFTPRAPVDDSPAGSVVQTTPSAVWLTDPATAVKLAKEKLSAAREAGEVPVFVIYMRPDRDCGGPSAGGAPNVVEYQETVAEVADVLGDGKLSFVVVEPDGTSLDCEGEDRADADAVLAEAVSVLSNVDGPRVYLDGGRPGWHDAADQARRLVNAGYANADGFSLNVSSFVTPERVEEYGLSIVDVIGGGFIADTSRAGAQVPDGDWCNPTGARVGPNPTVERPDPRVDGWFWIKRPGESDGPCNDGPAAGQWWPEGAAELFGFPPPQ